MGNVKGIILNGEWLGSNVIVNEMFNVIYSISPVVMQEFIRIVNDIEKLEDAIQINKFNYNKKNIIDIEFSNAQLKGLASLLFEMKGGEARLINSFLRVDRGNGLEQKVIKPVKEDKKVSQKPKAKKNNKTAKKQKKQVYDDYDDPYYDDYDNYYEEQGYDEYDEYDNRYDYYDSKDSYSDNYDEEYYSDQKKSQNSGEFDSYSLNNDGYYEDDESFDTDETDANASRTEKSRADFDEDGIEENEQEYSKNTDDESEDEIEDESEIYDEEGNRIKPPKKKRSKVSGEDSEDSEDDDESEEDSEDSDDAEKDSEEPEGRPMRRRPMRERMPLDRDGRPLPRRRPPREAMRGRDDGPKRSGKEIVITIANAEINVTHSGAKGAGNFNDADMQIRSLNKGAVEKSRPPFAKGGSEEAAEVEGGLKERRPNPFKKGPFGQQNEPNVEQAVPQIQQPNAMMQNIDPSIQNVLSGTSPLPNQENENVLSPSEQLAMLDEIKALKAELQSMSQNQNNPVAGEYNPKPMAPKTTLEEFLEHQRKKKQSKLDSYGYTFKIMGSNSGRLQADVLEDDVFIAGDKVYKWGKKIQLDN